MTSDLPTYPEYKDSGDDWLGRVPAHWQSTGLGAISLRRSERNRPDLPLLSVLREKGVVLRSSLAQEENHNFIPDDLSNYRVARAGDLVVNKMKAWQGSVGIAPTDGIVSPAYFVFDLSGITKEYAHRLLRCRLYADYFARASDGVRIGQWDLSIDQMKRIPVVVPPVDEQGAIVRYLDTMDRCIRRFIRNRRRLIEVLGEQKQAIINQAVTRGLDPNAPLKPSGIEWLGDIPEHWEMKRLKWVTRLQRGYDLPQQNRVAGAYPVVSSGGMIDTHNECRAKAPGVVMGRYGSTDAVFFIEQDFWPHNTSLFVTDFQGNDPRWCYYLLRTISKADHAGKSAVPGVDRKDLFDIRVVEPPFDEQQAIVQYIDRESKVFDDAIDRAKREIDLIREYRTRLIADVVTGKVDVRGLAPDAPLPEDEEIDEDLDGEETPEDEEPELAEEAAE